VLGAAALLEPRDHLVLAGGVGRADAALVHPLVLTGERVLRLELLEPAAVDKCLPHGPCRRVRGACAVACLLDRVDATGQLGGVVLACAELAGHLLARLALGVVTEPPHALEVEDEGAHCCFRNRREVRRIDARYAVSAVFEVASEACARPARFAS
jgi:hypothetical protein